MKKRLIVMKRWGQFNKKKVLDAYNQELQLANKRLLNLQSNLVGYKLGVIQPPAPTSLKMALDITKEIRKINSENITIDKDGRIVDIVNPSKYLRVQEILVKKFKGKEFRHEYKIFTGEQASKILKKQREVNKKRAKYNLFQIKGLRFSEVREFDEIYDYVSSKGSDEYIEGEMNRLVKGVITSLNSAYQKLVVSGDISGRDFDFIMDLILAIQNDKNAYKTLGNIVNNISTNQLVYMLSSDSLVFNPSPELFRIMEAYGINTNDYYNALNNLEEVNF